MKPNYEKYSELRSAFGYSDAEVASRAGITRSTFTIWKKGTSFPKMEKLGKIANVLGCKTTDMCEDGEKVDLVLSGEATNIAIAYQEADKLTQEMVRRILECSKVVNKLQ